MAELAEELDVVVDDPPPTDTGGGVAPPNDTQTTTTAPDAPKPAAVTPEEGIETLRAKLAASEARATAAERSAAEATHVAVGARNEIQDTNVNLLSNAVDSVRQSIDVHKRNAADAMAAGDFSAAEDARAEVSIAAAKLVQLETGLQALKNQPKATAPPIVDRVEGFAQQIASQGFVRSAAWVRAHPEYVNDPNLNRRMMAASDLATSYGIQPDSDAYFDAVERSLGLRLPGSTPPSTVDVPALSDASAPASSRSPPAAPVSRGVNGSGTGPRTVRLSAEQLEVAAMCGMTPEEYAKNLVGKPN